MSETAGFGMDWLPASVQRRMAVEDAAEAREARQAEQEREARREQLRDSALQAYRTAQEGRGEVVSAIALATGQVAGRSLGDVFADARSAADREDGRAAAAERRSREDVVYLDSEPRIAGRSAWPASEFEASRMISQAEELHRDLVAYRARTGYRDAHDAARAKAGR